ncbi:Retrovirus-related Pol polyprotein from transposon RE2 [Bienertia sinuspersici]
MRENVWRCGLGITEKLEGPVNYRSWKRSVEIALASKRKLGFVTGLVKRDDADAKKQEQWDTCNNLVISWLLGSMSDTVRKSVMYINTAREIWCQLERRFTVANGAVKYKLKKELYDARQNGATINDYYTKMSGIWEDLNSLNQLPPISVMTPEISAFVAALERLKEEQHLFQFLNGLDEDYGAQRSQVLLQSPLSSVEGACGSLQQEEAQREVLNVSNLNLEGSAMSSNKTVKQGKDNFVPGDKKGYEGTCGACGKKGHHTERCWTVIGYPKWHPKHNTQQRVSKKENAGAGQRWIKNKHTGGRMAAHAQGQGETNESVNLLTERQIKKLLKLVPEDERKKKGGSDTEEELDADFAGMVASFNACAKLKEWIVDSGASNHMICDINQLSNKKEIEKAGRINLPNGKSSKITHCGTVNLKNSMKLKRVLCVPKFKQNLMSVNKLMKQENYRVTFYPEFCVIQDLNTMKIRGVGRMLNGLYYLVNKPYEELSKELKRKVEEVEDRPEKTEECK